MSRPSLFLSWMIFYGVWEAFSTVATEMPHYYHESRNRYIWVKYLFWLHVLTFRLRVSVIVFGLTERIFIFFPFRFFHRFLLCLRWLLVGLIPQDLKIRRAGILQDEIDTSLLRFSTSLSYIISSPLNLSKRIDNPFGLYHFLPLFYNALLFHATLVDVLRPFSQAKCLFGRQLHVWEVPQASGFSETFFSYQILSTHRDLCFICCFSASYTPRIV